MVTRTRTHSMIALLEQKLLFSNCLQANLSDLSYCHKFEARAHARRKDDLVQLIDFIYWMSILASFLFSAKKYCFVGTISIILATIAL